MGEHDGLASLHERRFAANQTVFRRSNERLSRRLGSLAPEPMEYVCECGDDSCAELVPLVTSEYEYVRSKATWFVIAPGHEILPGDSERIMEAHDRHHVVEKSGPAGASTKATDIRLNRVAP